MSNAIASPDGLACASYGSEDKAGAKGALAEKANDNADLPISGTVKSKKGEPLVGVTIVVKNSSAGTATDVDGHFSLSVPDGNATLVISYVGFKSQEYPLNGQTTLSITLEESATSLDDVIVVAYGTQKKTSSSAAVSAVKGTELAQSPVPNITNSIAGRVSGVTIRANGGQPGADNASIQIRGIATTGNSAPLVVVDGIIRNNINQVDPNTIESVTVLKDAAAVAPYGVGGANGVLLITTKTGKSGTPTLSLSSYYGVQTPTVYLKMLSAKDYMSLSNEAYANANPTGTTPPYAADLVDNYDALHAQDPDKYPDSNFYRDIARLYVPVQNHSLQLTGGSERIRYYAGLGFFDQKGMVDKLLYRRYNYNVKLDADITKTTKVILSLNGSYENNNSTNGYINNIIWNAVKTLPTGSMRYSNGLPGAINGGAPLGDIQGGYAKTQTNTLLSSLSLEQQLPFLKGLSIRGTFAYDPTGRFVKNWHLPTRFYNINTSTTPYTFTPAIAGSPDINLFQEYTTTQNFTYQGYLNYHNTFGQHDLSGLVVAESRNSTYNAFSASRRNYTIPIDELDLGSSLKDDAGNGGTSSTGSQIGYVYRVGYNYAGKYFVETAGRYDGHYAFAPGKRFGYFPSVSGAWLVSEENFLKNKFPSLSTLKIRGSWGKTGNLPYINGNLASFQYLNVYNLYGNAYAFGQAGLVQGTYVPQEANPNITWEVSTKTDGGVEMSLWNGALNLEVDYFQEVRDRMLISPQAVVPQEYGLALPLENAGKMKNRGVEVALGANHRLKNGVQLGFTGNFTYAKNELVQVFENTTTFENPNRRQTGRPLNTPFGYHSLGLFSTADDVNGDGVINVDDGYTVNQFGAVLHPGDIKYADLNGDGKLDENDHTVIGYSAHPQITYGFTGTAAWKGLDLSLFFQGAANASIYASNFQNVPFSNNSSNTGYEYFDNYWRPDRQDAKYPRITPTPYSNNQQYSDFYMKNTGYIRLKTAMLGYTIPASVATKLGTKTVRVYVSGQNLLTYSKLKFIDPEEANVNTSGTYFYPNQKVYTVGLNVTF